MKRTTAMKATRQALKFIRKGKTATALIGSPQTLLRSIENVDGELSAVVRGARMLKRKMQQKGWDTNHWDDYIKKMSEAVNALDDLKADIEDEMGSQD